MDVVRAYELGIDPSEVRVTTHGGQYDNHWIVWIPHRHDPTKKEILTSSRDIFRMCRWKSQLRLLRDGP